MGLQNDFLPTHPPRGAWVFRCQVSPPLPPLPLPHLQSFVSLRYRMFLLGTENAVGGAWVFGSVCHLVSSFSVSTPPIEQR